MLLVVIPKYTNLGFLHAMILTLNWNEKRFHATEQSGRATLKGSGFVYCKGHKERPGLLYCKCFLKTRELKTNGKDKVYAIVCEIGSVWNI